MAMAGWPTHILAMCNAYNLRHRNEAILDIARAMQLPLDDLADFPPLHRIGIKQRGLILRPQEDGALTWSWARWSLVPPGSRELPPYPLNNARADKLDQWPWRAVQRQRCLIPASGFWEPEKPARAKGVAPWSYYSLIEGRPFFLAGLWSEVLAPATGEVGDTYTMVITDANALLRVHDRMPVIMDTAAERNAGWLAVFTPRVREVARQAASLRAGGDGKRWRRSAIPAH